MRLGVYYNIYITLYIYYSILPASQPINLTKQFYRQLYKYIFQNKSSPSPVTKHIDNTRTEATDPTTITANQPPPADFLVSGGLQFLGKFI